MRFTSIATMSLAALSFLGGLFLQAVGTGPWFVYQYPFGFYEMLVLVALGGLLVFLTLPIALFGFDSPPRWITGSPSLPTEFSQTRDLSLLSNRRIAGLSLVITGAIWIIFSLIGLWESIEFVMCPYRGCPSIFSYVGSWILIAIGALILATGITLVVMSKSKGSTKVPGLKKNALKIDI